MKTLILTKDNLVPSTYNNTCQMEFNPSFDTTNHKLAFVNCQLYYSFFNIDADLYQNNVISYYWIDGKKYDIIIENGGFEAQDIYNYLVVEMIKNKHYVKTTDGLYRYYFKINSSINFYRFDVTFYPLETKAEAEAAGYSVPEGSDWDFPDSYKLSFDVNDVVDYDATTDRDWRAAFMRLYFDDSYKTHELFGISTTGVFPPNIEEKMNTSVLDDFVCYSDQDPQLTPANTIIVHCDRVSNDLSVNNSTRIFSFSPSVSFGSQMDIRSENLLWLDLHSGSFQSISIYFTDEFNRPLKFNDKSVNIQLAIKEEYSDK